MLATEVALRWAEIGLRLLADPIGSADYFCELRGFSGPMRFRMVETLGGSPVFVLQPLSTT